MRSEFRFGAILLAAAMLHGCGDDNKNSSTPTPPTSDTKATVSAIAGTGGSVTPGSQSVVIGSTATVTVTADSGYFIDAVSGCGGTLSGNTFTTGEVSESCDVEATFAIGYAVTATAGVGGSITPASQLVKTDGTATLTVTPDDGYVVEAVTGCGGSLSGETFTSGLVTADCAVSATFVKSQIIFAGGSHTCFQLADGTAKCWGQNSSGQLGVSSFSLTAQGDEFGESPVTEPSVTMPDPSLSIRTMSLGSQHTCAILSDSNLYCWGEGQNGQTGLGINADRKTITDPVNLNMEAVVEVSAGGQLTCARLANDEVYCWGLNSSGELGIGTNDNHLIPSSPVDLDFAPLQIVTGAAHACARLENDTVQCWGDNSSGQLGDNNGGVDSNTPSNSVNLPAGAVTDVTAGALFNCAIVDTSVYCWGENGSGQLGNNDGTNTDLDVSTAALNIGSEVPVDVVGGGEHACVLTASGKVYCWGESDAGQTGQNDTTDDLAPVLVDFGAAYTVEKIAAGSDHTCVSLLPTDTSDTSRPVRCWGEGGVGQLGQETVSDIGDDEMIASPAYNLNF